VLELPSTYPFAPFLRPTDGTDPWLSNSLTPALLRGLARAERLGAKHCYRTGASMRNMGNGYALGDTCHAKRGSQLSQLKNEDLPVFRSACLPALTAAAWPRYVPARTTLRWCLAALVRPAGTGPNGLVSDHHGADPGRSIVNGPAQATNLTLGLPSTPSRSWKGEQWACRQIRPAEPGSEPNHPIRCGSSKK